MKKPSLSSRTLQRLLFWVFLAGGVLLVCEGTSYLVFRLLLGEPFSISRLAAVRANAGAVAAAAAEPGTSRPREAEVLHPYLGFVLDPGADRDDLPRQPWEPRVSPQGFYLSPRAAAALARHETLPPKALVIGVFGGSVAANFALQGDTLVKELRRQPPFQRRRIVVQSYALGGYKQPQQLMTLAYFLTLGQRFDVVINLDGFNDVVLAYSENVPQKIHPLYPRGWQGRVNAAPDRWVLENIGRITYLEARRARLAAFFTPPPLAWSVSANLVWRLLDRALQARVTGVRQRLAVHVAETSSFLTHGPAASTSESMDEGAALLRELAAAWQRASLSMHRLCAGGGIAYYHFLQPNQYVPGSKPLSREEKVQAYEASHPYREPAEKGYPYLIAAGEELRRQGVQFHDLSRLFAHDETPLYSDSCCHLNERGNALLSSAIAAVILEDFAHQHPAGQAPGEQRRALQKTAPLSSKPVQ